MSRLRVEQLKRRRVKEKKPSNKLVSVAIIVMVVIICVIVNLKGKEIKARNIADNAKISELQSQVAEEESRSSQLEEYRKYVNTKQFVEDMARNKLGLIYPDEIIFKADED